MSLMDSIWPDPAAQTLANCNALTNTNAQFECMFTTYDNSSAVRTRTMILSGLVFSTVLTWWMLKNQKRK